MGDSPMLLRGFLTSLRSYDFKDIVILDSYLSHGARFEPRIH